MIHHCKKDVISRFHLLQWVTHSRILASSWAPFPIHKLSATCVPPTPPFVWFPFSSLLSEAPIQSLTQSSSLPFTHSSFPSLHLSLFNLPSPFPTCIHHIILHRSLTLSDLLHSPAVLGPCMPPGPPKSCCFSSWPANQGQIHIWNARSKQLNRPYSESKTSSPLYNIYWKRIVLYSMCVCKKYLKFISTSTKHI